MFGAGRAVLFFNAVTVIFKGGIYETHRLSDSQGFETLTL